MGLKAIENSRFSCKTRNWSSPHHCVSKKQKRECTLAALDSWLGTVHLDKTIKGIPFVIFNDKKSSMGCYRRMIRKELDECSFTVKEAKSRESDSVGGRGGLSFKSPLLEEMRQTKRENFHF
ncbi:hypothetical protein ISN45_Aa08g009450 [Arabidopsis thaliana x Arabidopsis arenosa]|uniref:Uncharacterized protein n=1 Tax=Arabidopsis thaliana x Arabidopsis arenosa TaxID=1240361 RepID=A0A8T1XFQ9_9BRAS|nr:hypothetical protein ISN45_Aa08g009450 [Arabidopsis thaliana x Arabidopsis arenosa]